MTTDSIFTLPKANPGPNLQVVSGRGTTVFQGQGQSQGPTSRIGSILQNKYRIEALLDEGGCGAVYRATHLLLRGTVAIKFLLPALTQNRVLRARFEREAQLLANLSHPGIVAAHDYGEDSGELYLVMEYVAGRHLALVMDEHPRMPIERVVSIIDQVLDVLAAAHTCGVVHRDVKPSNVMLYEDAGGTERLKLLDFGLAFISGTQLKRVTLEGKVVGTVFYMAPEQCQGQIVGPPADIYSVGILLYQMLTERLPFTGKTPAEVMKQHLLKAPPPIQESTSERRIPPQLVRLTMRALEKSPGARPTANEMRRALQHLMEGSITTRPTLPPIMPVIVPMLPVETPSPPPAMVQPRPLPAVQAVVPNYKDFADLPPVAFWGYPSISGTVKKLFGMLPSHKTLGFFWPAEEMPPMQLGAHPVRAILIPGDAYAIGRLLKLRTDAARSSTPVLVTDVADSASVLPLIRAGASDITLTQADPEQLCRQVVRLIHKHP